MYFIAITIIIIPVLIVTYRMLIEILPALHFGAIYIPSSEDKIVTMLSLAKIKKGEKVVDLGSGDGRLVIAAAKQGAIATGIELHRKMNNVAKSNIKKFKLTRRASIMSENMWKTDLSKFDVVFLYGITYIMNKMEKKLLSELKTGCRVVSNNYQFPHWKPEKEVNNVRLYIKN